MTISSEETNDDTVPDLNESSPIDLNSDMQ